MLAKRMREGSQAAKDTRNPTRTNNPLPINAGKQRRYLSHLHESQESVFDPLAFALLEISPFEAPKPTQHPAEASRLRNTGCRSCQRSLCLSPSTQERWHAQMAGPMPRLPLSYPF